MNLWIHYDARKNIRPPGLFETHVNGQRPGPCTRAFAFMGFGAAEFIVKDKKGRYRFDRRNRGLLLKQWLFGWVTFR